MANVKWDHSKYVKNAVKKGLDGLEEWGRVEWQPLAYENAPKKSTTMAKSLGVERDEKNKCIYVGGGGAAKAYIKKQELDASLHHEVGKSGFIRGAVQAKIGSAAKYIQARL